MLITFGVAALGVAPLLGHDAWAVPFLVASVIAALLRAVLGRRAARRAELTDRLVEAVSPMLGVRAPDRRVVQVRKWTRGKPWWSELGEPRFVRLAYAPGAQDDDPAWRSDLVKTVSRRLLANYQVAKHDRRRLRLHLVLTAAGEEGDQTPAIQARAERHIQELLGSNATLSSIEWNGEELKSLRVDHEAGVKVASPAYRTRIERVVSTVLPGRWRARWNLLEDSVTFEIRPPLPEKVDHPEPSFDADHLHRIPLAVGEDGETITWNLRGTAPHMIVVGKTGQGKTVVINGVVTEFCSRGWPVRICDPKRIEFMGMRGWPNVEVVATTVEDQIALIHQTWKEMERRYELIETGQATEDDFEPMLLVLDEYRDFVGSAQPWYQGIKVRGMPTKCPAFEWVASLARKGRSARIHLLLGTQRPDADFLSGEMRDNFATRMSLGRLSPQGAMMMWEAAYIGVAVPRKPGRGTAVDDNDRPVEIQAYWTPDPRKLRTEDAEDRKILEQLRPGETNHPQMRIELAEDLLTDLDDETGKNPPPYWDAVVEATLVPVIHPAPDPLDPAADAPAESEQDVLSTVQELWPALHTEYVQTDRFHLEDPTSCVVHARRALELLVGHVYTARDLPSLPDADLLGRMNAPVFTQCVEPVLLSAMHRIRKAGNSGAHPGATISTATAKKTLQDLHRLLVWAADTLSKPSPPPRPAPSTPVSAGADEGLDPDSELGDPLDADYGPPEPIRPGRVRAGDLILVEEDLDLWGVVVSEPEELDESLYSLEWRSDDEDGGWLEIPDDTSLTVRRPLDETEED